MFQTPQVSARWREAIVAALLLPVLFLGALEIHPAGDAHDSAGSRTLEAVFSCANGSSGPVQHAHAATARELPPCPVCLLRMQVRGAQGIAAAASLAAPTFRGRLHAVADPAIDRVSLDPWDARGPPAS